MTVRRAAAADTRSIAEVHVSSWQAAYRGLLPDSFLAGLSVERRTRVWDQLIPDPQLDTFVAEDAGGKIVAFANLAPSRDSDALPDTGELTAIYAEPEHWGCGYGSALLRAVLAAARTRGFRRLTLWVLQSNRRATEFYERAGFTPDGAEKTETRSEEVILHERRHRLELEPPPA